MLEKSKEPADFLDTAGASFFGINERELICFVMSSWTSKFSFSSLREYSIKVESVKRTRKVFLYGMYYIFLGLITCHGASLFSLAVLNWYLNRFVSAFITRIVPLENPTRISGEVTVFVDVVEVEPVTIER